MRFVIHALGLISGGGKASVLHLVPALAEQGCHEYVAVLPDLPEYAAISAPNLRVVHRPSFTRRNLIVREWWLNHTVPRLCREERADALLCLGNFVPHRPPVPTVVLLQNAYYVYRDDGACRGLTLRQRIILRYGRYQFRHLPANVNVAVQTSVMKHRLVSHYAIADSRVHVIPDRGAIGDRFSKYCVRPQADCSEPFTFFCPAVYFPSKNLEVLVGAVKRLRGLSLRQFRCALTIEPGQHPGARRLLAEIGRQGLGESLTTVGLVPSDRLASVYASADAFILPTLLESFGRPYLEAMQFGLPILTSDRDFARGRCQDAAIYFDPLDADSVAQAMARVMEDADLRRELVENGRRVLAGVPTWDEIANMFVDILERTARGELPPQSTPQRQHASVA